ncbi:hypothetical protein G6F40_013800 [Rhizopus arrhizus]|nr:hypothetical protein G6F40_013800 [Rhizopus arrhizus]
MFRIVLPDPQAIAVVAHQAAIGGGPDVALAILGQRQHHARGHAFGRAETAQAWCFRHFKGRSRCGERHQQQPHSRDASPPQAPAARHPDPPVLGRLSHRPGFMTATAWACAYDRNVPLPEPAIDASLPGPAADAARHRPRLGGCRHLSP